MTVVRPEERTDNALPWSKCSVLPLPPEPSSASRKDRVRPREVQEGVDGTQVYWEDPGKHQGSFLTGKEKIDLDSNPDLLIANCVT